MESIRLPRFKRVAAVEPMQLTERDRDILRQVRRHRFLRSSHILALIGGSSQQVLRRLQRLYHHGYLDRPRAQIDYFHRGGSRHMVYGLGTQGARMVQDGKTRDGREIAGGGLHSSVGRLFLEHALLTSDVMVGLELACRRHGRVKLLTGGEFSCSPIGRQERDPFQWQVRISSEILLGLVPDHVFALEFLDQPAEQNRVYYFLEADRGTMPVTRRSLKQSSFHRKLVAYEATWKQKLHQTRFGFPRFRVLTVTTSAGRAKHLAETATRLGSGHGLFLFTHAEAFRTHPDPLSLLWDAPSGRRQESLLGELSTPPPCHNAESMKE